jgi:hypothetical protein
MSTEKSCLTMTDYCSYEYAIEAALEEVDFSLTKVLSILSHAI